MFNEFREISTVDQKSYDRVRPKTRKTRIKGPLLCGIGSAFPETSYTQKQVGTLLGIENKVVHKLLAAEHIKTRSLYLPPPEAGETSISTESPEQLIQKFEYGILDIGVKSVQKAIDESPFKPGDIDFIICVTSSGFKTPGISSEISRALKLSEKLYRLDVVGMGCNAGMTALRTAASLAKDGKNGVLLCCEINSAIYVKDESVRTGIVNSLFGDGAVAVVISNQKNINAKKNKSSNQKNFFTELIDFESYTLNEHWDAMKFDWNTEQGRWSFGLSKQIPFVVGENLKHPVQRVLRRNNVNINRIMHWSLHTGGAAVIEGSKKSLGLSDFDVRHTHSVMRDYGNISSGSFLVSLERLLKENVVVNSDQGILAAMGPGATLEACLVKYHSWGE